MKRSIAIDFDGVVADTATSKRAWLRVRAGISLGVGEYSRSSLMPLIGEELYLAMQGSVGYSDTLECPPVLGAIEAITRLASSRKVYIVTARPQRKVPWVEQWLEKNDIQAHVQGVHSTPGSKMQLALELGCIALIDDDPRHLRSEAEEKVFPVLFSAEADPFDALVLRARSWHEAESIIERLEPHHRAREPVAVPPTILPVP